MLCVVVAATAGIGYVGLRAAGAERLALPVIGPGGATASKGAVRLLATAPPATVPSTTVPSAPVVLPTSGSWSNVTANLAGAASECGNLTMVSGVPGQDAIIAGVANRGLFRSTNGGANWTAIGTGSGSATITNRASSIVYDPTTSNTFWESGIYNGGGVYRTTDNGATFQQLGSVTHIDQVAVDLTDPARRTLLAGGHEQAQKLWRSADGGATWTEIGVNLPAGTGFSTNPIIINSTTYLINTTSGYIQGTPGIYRTTNSGASWTKVSDLDAIGQAAVTPSMIAWRVTNGTVAVSTNQGQTWTARGNNISVPPVALPDGRLLAASNDHVVVSADASTWTNVGPNQPFTPASITYLAARNAVFVSYGDCGNTVPNNAIARLQ